MRFMKKLYLSDSMKRRRTKAIWNLKYNKKKANVYVVALAPNRDLLEIYHSFQLNQTLYQDNPPFIVGLAADYEEAVELVQRILMDTLQSTGGFDVKQYCCTFI